jgi:peptidoglycan/xylan/chitin deacetylase (PgdA/CDA1 family)
MRRPVTILLCLGALLGVLVGAPPAVAAATTVVSLTFDDGYDNHVVAGQVLAQYGVHGTFFVNSGDLGTTRHLTWAQVDQLAAAGNEIGGHTISHADLTTVDATTARREVCDDRTALLNRGYAVTNFAYPYGHGFDDPTIRSIVQQCGYNSARMAWGIGDGVYAETLPPSDVWAVKSPSSADAATLAQLQAFVTGAETHGGGWVPFYFHDICDGCSSQAVSPSILSAFLDWLAPRAATGTTVNTIAQVIGGPVQPPPGSVDSTPPVTTISCNGSPCGTGWFASPVQVTLTATDDLSGVAVIRYTTDGSVPTANSTAYTTPFTVSSTSVVTYRAWDNAGNVEAARSQQIKFDTTGPSVAITSPTNGATVQGTVKVQATAADSESGVASVNFYVDGTKVAVATKSPYQFSWNTKKVPAGTHTLTAQAVDRAGNTTLSSAISVLKR